MQRKTTLLVDDERHILNVVSIKLQNAGYAVITAENGREAYDLARQARPDLIITDYQMPLLSGVELCAKLSADPSTRDIPVIMLTARGFAISEQDKACGNIKQVVDKPFSPREILECVRAFLEGTPVGSH